MENKKGNKKNIFVIVISVFVLTLIIVGTSLAYFVANITGNESLSNSVIVNTADLAITYDTGNIITVEKAVPGWSETKVFTVKNEGTVTVYYNIDLEVGSNTFVNKDELVYNVTGKLSTGDVEMPSTDYAISVMKPINPGETHTYNFKVTFKNMPYAQNDNQGKSFSGRILIKES